MVARDVPDYGLVWGNPARLQAFVCPCGERLQKVAGGEDVAMACPKCGARVEVPAEVYCRLGGGR